MSNEVRSLSELLDALADASEHQDDLSLQEVMETAGSRSLGPLLLVAGLITLAPIVGDIPGVPTIMALFVLLVAVQLLYSHSRPWLPKWLLNRSVSREKLCKVLGWLRKPARFIDRFTRRRLSVLVEGKGRYLVAIVCIVIALMMPIMEVVPFSANGAGLALSAFGLALIARDGAIALGAFVVVSLLVGIIGYSLM